MPIFQNLQKRKLIAVFCASVDSSLKELLKTPVTTQVSHAEECQQSVVRSALPAEGGANSSIDPILKFKDF